jgi:hypothetical protein
VRVFLDSNTLQALQEQGEAIYDGGDFNSNGRSGAVPEDVEALRNLFLVASRAGWELALSANSLSEVKASGELHYLAWAFEMCDYWQDCLDAAESPFAGWGVERARELDDARFDYLSEKDRLLIRDALTLECDAFLTIEKRLARNAPHLLKELGLHVVRPPELAEALFLQPRHVSPAD